MKLRWQWHSASALAIGCAVLSANALEPGERRLVVRGFGTIGAIYHDEDGFEYRRTQSQSRGAEAGKVDFATDSVAGVQFNASWNAEVEAVAQLVTHRNTDNTWWPRLSRGFLRYRPMEELMLRAGRIGYELLPLTDSRDIGYSYLTIRPPVEVLGIIPQEDFDGVDITLSRAFGDRIGRAKLYGGRTSGEHVSAQGTTDLSGSKIWGGHLEYLQGAWIGRVGHGFFLSAKTPDLDPLVAALRQTGSSQAAALADDFAKQERRIGFSIVGLTYDQARVQARLLLARTFPEHLTGPRTESGFLTLGRSFDAFTPYVAVSAIHSYGHARSTGLPDDPALRPLNGGAATAQSAAQTEQRSYSLGLRYDLAPKMDLKFQVDRVFLGYPNTVIDNHMPPRDKADMTVFGVAFDFTF